MSRSLIDFKDSYHDDPATPVKKSGKRSPRALFSLLVLAIGGSFLVQTTLASNISLGSGAPVEFGQGIMQTTACSGSQPITVTPVTDFVNAASAGSFKFKSITVSGIPADCYGTDFTLSAYGQSDNAKLALFNTTTSDIVVHNNAGTFEAGVGGTGITISSGSGSFTVSFDAPVSLASAVYKVTIQSGPHTVWACALGGPCVVNGAGQAGGTIYYYNASGFSCGASYSATGSPDGGLCHYLEVAPNTWGGTSTDLAMPWVTSANAFSDIASIANDGKVRPYPSLSTAALGLGYKNSELILAQGNDATTAAGAARAYNGGSKSDWYLPTETELNLLCQWSRGVATNVTTSCVGGSLVKGNFEPGPYWSSSEASNDWAWYLYMSTNYLTPVGKSSAVYLRPIRAF